MAAITLPRRPGVVMSTPPPSRASAKYTQAEKQTLLDNFDLEVADKTRAFRSSLAATLASFSIRTETEVLKIPRELRSMTLGELEAKWGGNWAGTMQRIARERVEAEMRERERDEEEKRAKEQGKGKRKRGTANTLESPQRISKNARTAGSAADQSGKAPILPSGKRKPIVKSAKAGGSSSSSSKPPSSLPQNHIFNPTLPPTPLRALRQNETILYSSNGSPVSNPLTSIKSVPKPSRSSSQHRATRSDLASSDDDEEEEDEQDDSGSDSDSDSDELPDPELLEAKLLSKLSAPSRSTTTTTSAPTSKSSRKPKRAPSFIFQPSSASASTSLLPPPTPNQLRQSVAPRASIQLTDGRTMMFNPLDLSPGRIEEEMRDGGLDEREREMVKGRVREEVVRALASKMEKWSVV